MNDRANGDPGRAGASFPRYVLILALPLALFCLPPVLRGSYGPYYLGYNSDPEYVYLLNSLNILDGAAPRHTDHPGTTVQLLGAAALSASWAGHRATGGRLGLNEFVLRHPEESLAAINAMLNLLVLGAFVFSSLCVHRALPGLAPTLVFQLSLLVPLRTKISLLRVAPEPLLVAAALLLSGLLVRHRPPGDAPREGQWTPVAVGVVTGFGIATKITFLPVALAIGCLRPGKPRRLASAACLVSFLLFTLPIVGRLPETFSWFGSLIVHSGRYGHGETGLPAVAELARNLATLVAAEPFLFVFLACYLAWLAVRRSGGGRPPAVGIDRRLALGAGMIVAQAMATAKHPSAHYMLPAMAMTAWLNSELAAAWTSDPPTAGGRLGRGLFHAIILAGLVHGTLSTMSWAAASREYVREEAELSKRIDATDGHRTIFHYRATSVAYALAFGNQRAGERYGDALSVIHPGAIFYNVWSGDFHDYLSVLDRRAMDDVLERGNPVLMVGIPLAKSMRRGLVVTPILERPDPIRPVAVHRLERLKGGTGPGRR